MLDKIFDTLQTVCLGYDYYVTTECAQTICAPLLQNTQYTTEVRRFSAHTRNRCVMKITKYPDVLALQYWPLFYTYFAIDFSERAIPANIDQSILLTARMGRYGVKVALLRCLIRLIIYHKQICLHLFDFQRAEASFGSPRTKVGNNVPSSIPHSNFSIKSSWKFRTVTNVRAARTQTFEIIAFES